MPTATAPLRTSTDNDPFDPFLTVKGSAAFIKVSDVTIRRMLTEKKLRRFKAGGRTLIKQSDLMQLVKEVK